MSRNRMSSSFAFYAKEFCFMRINKVVVIIMTKINILDYLKKKSVVSIFDVAKYIHNECGEISRVKLQLLCYYCQAWSLALNNKPLFFEEFEAWTIGPICVKLFNETEEDFFIIADSIPGDMNNLKVKQKETIDAVLDHYAEHNIQYLAQLARSEAPWREVSRAWFDDNNIITKESMASYYGSL